LKETTRSLERTIRGERGKHEYDCLVPLSGGKDSTYAAYVLRRKYNLNPLVLTMNVHLLSPQTLENIETTVRKLDVDHVTIKYRWSLCRELFRSFILRSGMSPRAICWVCNMLLDKTIFETLTRYDIPYFITGNSEDQLALFKQWEKILGFKETGSETFDYWFNWHNAYLKLLKRVLPRSRHKLIQEALYPEPRLGNRALNAVQIPLFKYERYDVNHIIDEIRKELGWKLPMDVGGTENDCMGLQFAVYLYRKQHGDQEYQQRVKEIVASGRATEEIAERAINNRDYSIKNFFYKELDLSDEDFRPDRCDPYLEKWLNLLKPIR
jgi:hypothetical protein